MELNKEYKQLSVSSLKNYNELSGKVVDKIAFYDSSSSYDEKIFIILFTDKTFIAVGIGYDSEDRYLILEDNIIFDPKNIGDFRYHVSIDSNNELKFEKWIQILIDFGIWKLDTNEVCRIIEENKRKEEEREYTEYLRLKEKYEKRDNSKNS